MYTVPNLLRFQPQESLLVVGFAGRQIMAAARIDLAAVNLAGMLDTLTALQRGGATEVTAMIFSDVPTPSLPTPETVHWATCSTRSAAPRSDPGTW